MKKMLSMIASMLLLCTFAQAQDAGKSGAGVAEWLRSIQKKIEQLVPKKTVSLSTSVAGVRGAKENTKQKLYWKGKAGEEPVTEEELGKFRSGVEFAANGDGAAAARELEAFMKQYPDSALIPDAKKTLDLVKAENASKK